MIRSDRRLTPRARFFVPQLERALEVTAVVALLGMIVSPLVWGYEQRQQARVWQETACAYRLREVARETNVLVRSDGRGRACTALRDLGLDVTPPYDARAQTAYSGSPPASGERSSSRGSVQPPAASK
jgi:hypothetical protein